MTKKWFQHNEVMAGAGRLVLSFHLYKIFGEWLLRLIAFLVSAGAFFLSGDRRQCSYQFFKSLEKYTNQRYLIRLSAFRQFVNYGNALVDKIISFSGNMPIEKFHFADDESKNILEIIKNKQGIFFLTTHIGNVEILRSILQSEKYECPSKINIFLEKRSCEIFNAFLNSLKSDTNKIVPYAVEDILVDTAIELSEKLEQGELIFMAGDRVSFNNPKKTYNAQFLNKSISLPVGALKLAQILNTNIFFIICVKEKDVYNIYAQSFSAKNSNKKEAFEQLKNEYSAFLEKYAIKYPHQFYHFYQFFDE